MTDEFIEICKFNHFYRIAKACKDLFNQEDSICEKCHKTNQLSCLWCYCPYYNIKNCGGDFTITEQGIKDCSKCLRFVDPYHAALLFDDMFRVYEEHLKIIYNE